MCFLKEVSRGKSNAIRDLFKPNGLLGESDGTEKGVRSL